MSDSNTFKDGEVVWVKWGNVWWPGEVWSDTRVPEDIITSLRKPVIAFVKFFQEDSFEFVRSPNNICKYNAEKKMEFIKKGMDKYRSNNKIMANFPADVVKAEQLTNGNVNILSSLETPTKSKGTPSSVASSPATKPAKLSLSMSSPVVTSKTAIGSYNSSVKVQNTTSPAQKSNDKKLTCTMCNFATDRMNLLMMHIKNHSLSILSRVNSSSSLDIRRPIVPKVSTRNHDDGIAEDVRKIKESMKETATPTTSTASTKKTRTPVAATASKATPKLKQSRQSTRKDKKQDNNIDDSKKDEEKPIKEEKTGLVKSKKEDEETEVEVSKPKSINTCELKNELLADWLDEEDVKMEDTTKATENEKPSVVETPIEKPVIDTPIKTVEKQTIGTTNTSNSNGGEVSRSIRNIPKKQRVSEMYIQPEPEKVELSNALKNADENSMEVEVKHEEKSIIKDESSSAAATTTPTTAATTTPTIAAESTPTPAAPEMNNKKSQQKSNKRKHPTSDSSNEPEKKKLTEDLDEKILLATAELLNETEVPKISNTTQSPSTFLTNDIDKRYLPPKERNKRIFRARNSPETMSKPVAAASIHTEKEKLYAEYELKIDDKIEMNSDQLQQLQQQQVVSRQELMLPHKKKQSSRLLTAEKLAVNEVGPQIEKVTMSATNQKSSNKKSRKSTDSQKMEVGDEKCRKQEVIDEMCKKMEVMDEMCKKLETIDEKCKKLEIMDEKCRNLDDTGDKNTITDEKSKKIEKVEEKIIKTDQINDKVKKKHPQSPLCDEVPPKVVDKSTPIISTTETSPSDSATPKRPSKRPHSKDSDTDEPEAKKPLRTIRACSSETICITSKGTLSIARRDSIKTTIANSIVVTSQVIITEPLVSSHSSMTSHDMVMSSSSSPKQQSIVSTTTTSTRSALQIPKENIEEMKKQGLLTIENNRTKLTPKGRQKFKEYQNSSQSSLKATSSSNSDSSISSSASNIHEESMMAEEAMDVAVSETQVNNNSNKSPADDKKDAVDVMDVCNDKENSVKMDESEKCSITESDELAGSSKEVSTQNDTNNTNKNSVEDDKKVKTASQDSEQSQDDDSTNNNKNNTNNNNDDHAVDEKFPCKSTNELESDNKKMEVDKSEPEVNSSAHEKSDLDEPVQGKPEPDTSTESIIENGKDDELEDSMTANDDEEKESDTTELSQDSGNAGLIALQAETFGGPANCFYLCRQIEDRYEPVDNQILVLNAQNALVPYDGALSDLGLASTVPESNLQLSPNSNIIINTPNGQKIELNHLTILAIQQEADENGIASIELAGEPLELNINAIFEAIAAQQEVAESSESLIAGQVLLDGSDCALIIDSDIPMDVHHPSVATQVSETLSKPIMSTTLAPEIAINPTKPTISERTTRMLNIDDSLATIGVNTTQRPDVPKSLELPITVTNPKIAETVNHRKLAASLGTDIPDSFVVQQSTDNGSDD